MPERAGPAAHSCVRRHVAISSIRLGGVAVGRAWKRRSRVARELLGRQPPLLVRGCYCSSGERLHAPGLIRGRRAHDSCLLSFGPERQEQESEFPGCLCYRPSRNLPCEPQKVTRVPASARLLRRKLHASLLTGNEALRRSRWTRFEQPEEIHGKKQQFCPDVIFNWRASASPHREERIVW